MSFKNFAHRVTSLVVDTDDEEPKAATKVPAASAPAPNPVAAPSFTPRSGDVGSPFSVPNTVVLDEKVYQSVLSKTNFDTTPVGKTIHKYFDALEGSGLDTNARFKAAMKQAAALDNITPDQMLQTFDQLQAALDRDAQGFAGVAATVEKNEITSRQDRIAAKKAQRTQLEQEIAQLESELADQQSSHSNATTQFGLAQQRRFQEIAAQKAQFAALLH